MKNMKFRSVPKPKHISHFSGIHFASGCLQKALICCVAALIIVFCLCFFSTLDQNAIREFFPGFLAIMAITAVASYAAGYFGPNAKKAYFLYLREKFQKKFEDFQIKYELKIKRQTEREVKALKKKILHFFVPLVHNFFLIRTTHENRTKRYEDMAKADKIFKQAMRKKKGATYQKARAYLEDKLIEAAFEANSGEGKPFVFDAEWIDKISFQDEREKIYRRIEVQLQDHKSALSDSIQEITSLSQSYQST